MHDRSSPTFPQRRRSSAGKLDIKEFVTQALPGVIILISLMMLNIV